MRTISPIPMKLRYWRKPVQLFTGILLVIGLSSLFINSQTTVVESSNFQNQRCDFTGILPLPMEEGRFDSRRIIKIYEWVWKGSQWKGLMENYDVCLSTQGSLDRIHWIPEVLEKWQGPISLAVYITSSQEWIALNILVNHFGRCNLPFRQFISIHIALPSELEFSMDSVYYDPLSVEEFPCNRSKEFMKYIIGKFPRGDKGEEYMTYYPQNHMRNVARKTCGTKWVWATDIDIIPQQGSAKLLQEFYESSDAQDCYKCAFVIPTYELDNNATFPSTKKELIEYEKRNLSQPFHFGVFRKGHMASNYELWASSIEDEQNITVSHDADRQAMKYYEPFYISLDTIPAFEERFIGYGFTRSSQIQEALSEGWVFKVLSPIFSIHWGFQKLSNLLAPNNKTILRRQQTFNNSRIFSRFVKELTFKKTLKLQSRLKHVSRT